MLGLLSLSITNSPILGGSSFFLELCAPLFQRGGIHPAPVTANPPLEKFHPQGGPHLFPPLLPLEKTSLSPFSSGNLKLTFQMLFFFFRWGFSFVKIMCIHPPFSHVKTPYSWGMWGLECIERVICPEHAKTPPKLSTTPPRSSSLGMPLSAHASPQLHRCCCIVWSTEAPKPRSAQLGAPTH